ncbi:MAG: nicotinamide-nucleotide amidohydrolase family protein [Oscillospiraceae bacterium]|nr:nicotinamide-nucleotide amidohydrolase family protein [Oscillospiraceae bacterium]
MEAAALAALKRRGLTLSLAESCTGGLMASRITDVPGSSEAFVSSAVTYSNESKMALLGVRAETLCSFGAVSAETAREMAEGARRVFGSDIAVSATGIAGPGGGSPEKPAGLVYLALSCAGGTYTKELRLNGPRARVRNIACLNAFDMIRRAALGLPQVD